MGFNESGYLQSNPRTKGRTAKDSRIGRRKAGEAAGFQPSFSPHLDPLVCFGFIGGTCYFGDVRQLAYGLGLGNVGSAGRLVS